MAGSRFRLRFRKSFTVIPKVLKFTVNKKSWSLNFTLGPYSRSWGNRRSTSGVDLPGEYGLSMRKEHRRTEKFDYGGIWTVLTVLVVLLHTAIGLTRLYVWPALADCTTTGHPALLTLCLLAAELLIVWKIRHKLITSVVLLTAGSVAYWMAWSAAVGPSIHC